MKQIMLTRGLAALVDDEDYEWLSQWKWCAAKNSRSGAFYAARNEKPALILMHRQIMSAPRGLVVDHINHNTLDNQRANLRLVTYSQNLANRHKGQSCSSRFLGVSWDKNAQKWRSTIIVEGQRMHLGMFSDETEAALAYDAAARAYRDGHATTNFDKVGSVS